MILITTYIMLIFRLYRATPYSRTFERSRGRRSFRKKKKRKSGTPARSVLLKSSLKSGTNDKLSHFCDKNLLNSCCIGAIKEDLQSCSSLIAILRVSRGENFHQRKRIFEYFEQTFSKINSKLFECIKIYNTNHFYASFPS